MDTGELSLSLSVCCICAVVGILWTFLYIRTLQSFASGVRWVSSFSLFGFSFAFVVGPLGSDGLFALDVMEDVVYSILRLQLRSKCSWINWGKTVM